MVVFAYQGEENLAVDSHTYAIFYRGEELEEGIFKDPLTISWLPQNGIVPAMGTEVGKNFSLQETNGIAKAHHYRRTAYGPYEIKENLYHQAERRVAYLNSGKVLYKMIPGPLSVGTANCITAVSALNGPMTTQAEWGDAASRHVVRHMSPRILNYPSTNPMVAEIVGLAGLIDP